MPRAGQMVAHSLSGGKAAAKLHVHISPMVHVDAFFRVVHELGEQWNNYKASVICSTSAI